MPDRMPFISLAAVAFVAACGFAMSPSAFPQDFAELLEQEAGGEGVRPLATQQPAAEQADDKQDSPAEPATSQDSRLPVPSAAERSASAATVREIFGGDVARADTDAKKAALARKLMGHADGSSKPADKFVLLEAARRLAGTAGDAPLVIEVINSMAATFAIDAAADRCESLQVLAKTTPVNKLGDVCDLLLREASRAVAAGRLDAAEDLAKDAAMAARRGRAREPQKKAVGLLKEIREQQKQLAKITPYLEQLAKNPRDAAAATEVGRYYCVEKRDWPRGLAVLKNASDAPLATLAADDLSAGDDTGARVALGDRWFAFAEDQPTAEQPAWLSRAEHHYLAAINGLSGLNQVRIKKRLDEITQARVAAGGSAAAFPPGLILHFDATNLATINGGLPANSTGPIPVTRWQSAVGGATATLAPNSPPPAWSATAFDGKPGIVFSGQPRLTVAVDVPSPGTVMVVCKPTKVANHRVVGGAAHLMFRQDGRIWLECRSGASKPTIIPNRECYSANSQSFLAGTWPNPFAVVIAGCGMFSGSGFPAGGSLSREPLVIGGQAPNSTEAFAGVVQQVMLFSRSLPPPEIDAALGSLGSR
jgi:hypothetical protein